MKNNNKPDWSKNGNNATHSFEFIGAIIVYLLKFGKENSNTVAHPKNSKRNIIVGNIFCGIILILIIIIVAKIN